MVTHLQFTNRNAVVPNTDSECGDLVLEFNPNTEGGPPSESGADAIGILMDNDPSYKLWSDRRELDGRLLGFLFQPRQGIKTILVWLCYNRVSEGALSEVDKARLLGTGVV